jgi:hypothetical protein
VRQKGFALAGDEPPVPLSQRPKRACAVQRLGALPPPQATSVNASTATTPIASADLAAGAASLNIGSHAVMSNTRICKPYTNQLGREVPIVPRETPAHQTSQELRAPLAAAATNHQVRRLPIRDGSGLLLIGQA